MLFSVIVVTALVLLVLSFFLLKGKTQKEHSLAVIKSTIKSSRKTDRTFVSAPDLSPLQEDGEETIHPVDGFSTLNWMIKNNVQASMENIYADQYINPYPLTVPLEYRNVSSETTTLSGIDFRN